MKIKMWECAQSSDEWHNLRMGIPTASAFDRIMQPSKMGYAAAAEGYACELAIERLLGESVEPIGNLPYVERGKVLEPHAIAHFEVLYGKTAKVGFISDPELKWGCSPDAILVGGEIGGLELKSPAAHTHAKYMVSDDPGKDYVCQLQGSMMITGFPCWYFMSYHPGLPEVVFRYERDEKFIKILRGHVETLRARVDEICAKIKSEGEIGYARQPTRTPNDMNLVGKIIETTNWGG